MKLHLPIFLYLILLYCLGFAQQGCPDVNINVLGQDTTINCCGTLTASYVPNAQTTSYTVGQIPYLPFPFTGGTPVLVNIDDIWSGVINLPFTFCFYGNTYTQCVIGANGLISFDLSYANAYCQWPINAPIPSVANPTNAIMGPFHDIDPSVGGSINYQLYGSYPCRILVVNWNNVPMFQCNNLIDKQQIVIYETTNVIETYIANKPTCGGFFGWNGGAAIHGIQNATGTLATVVPGRNYPTTWNASNDARRFTPSGGASNVTLNWYEAGNPTVLGTGASIQVCPSGNTNYVVQAVYDPCVGGNIFIYDTVMVNVNGNTSITSTSQVNIACNGGNTGSAAFTYQTTSIDPVAIWWSPAVSNGTSATNLTAGTYTAFLSDTSSLAPPCTVSYTFTIVEPPALNAVVSSISNVNCFGESNGNINITTSGGVSPYFFSWNNGQTTEDLTNIPAGNYNLNVTDANNCSTSINNIIITEPSQLSINAISSTPATCGNANGTTNVVVAGGIAPYNYTWNNNPIPNNSGLSNLSGGLYTINISDLNGCLVDSSITVDAPLPVTITADTFINPLCFGGTGSASISVINGTNPILFSWSPNVSATNTATNIPAGSYFVSVSDFYNCTDTQSFVLTQPSALNVVVTSVTNVNCFAESNGAIDISSSGGVLPYLFSWNNGQITEDLANIPAGNYDITVTDSNNCTFSINNISVTEPPILAISSLSATPATCGNANGTTQVVVTGGSPIYAYTWNNDTALNTANLANLNGGIFDIHIADTHGCTVDSSITVDAPLPVVITADTFINPLCFGGTGSASISVINGTNPILFSWSPNVSATNTATNIPAGNYFVTVSDFYNCTDTQSFVLTQPSALNAVVTSVTNVNCFAELNGAIDISSSGGVLPYLFSWNNGQTTEDLANIPTGNYNITVTDSNNCIFSINNIAVTEPPILSISSLSATPATCGNANGTTQVVVTGGSPIYTYTWNNNPALNTDNLANLNGGVYTIHIADTHGCTIDSTITVDAPLPVTIAGNLFTNPSCFGGTGSLSVSIMNGTNPINFSWSPNVSLTNTANNIPAGSYFVTVSDFYNCTDTQTFVLTEPPLLTVNVTNTNNPCFGDAKAMAVATAQGGVAPYTYSWSNGFVGNDSLLNLPAGNYTAYIADSHNCLTSQNFVVTQPPQLTGLATGDTVCFGFSDGTASVVIGGGTQPYNYLWSNGDTTNSTSNLPAGVYIVQVTDANGCTITQNTQVIASTLPVIIPTNVQNVKCFGESNGAISVNIQNGVSPFAYNWNPVVSGNNTANNLAIGNYQLIVTDHFSCKDTMSFTITQPTLLQANTTFENVQCNGAKNGTADVFAQGGTQGYTYTWNTIPPRYTHNVSYLAAGTYTVTVHDANLCTTTETITITEPPAIVVNLVNLTPSICSLPNGSIFMTASGGTGALTYSWSNNLSQDTFLQNIVGNEVYSFYVTDANGCQRAKTVPLTDVPPAEAAFSSFPTNDEGIFVNTPIHFINQSQKARSYLWLFGDGDFETVVNPVHQYVFPDSNITVMLIAYNGTDLCPDTATMNFVIIPEGVLWFPNVFTPNGDGHNDVYNVKGLQVISFNMTIYDRWGKVIKELKNMDDFWDGTKNGKDCPEGVYTFTAWGLTINNISYKRAGTITLIR